MIVYQISVFLHTLSAVVWIGGMFFLALKLGVILVMLGLSSYHDFVIGLRSVRALEQLASTAGTFPSGRPAPASRRDLDGEAGRLRRCASVVGRLEAILAILVLALAIMLVRGAPSPF